MSYLFAAIALAALGYLIFAFIHLLSCRLALLARWDDRIDTVLPPRAATQRAS